VLLTVGASLGETSTFNWSKDLSPSKTMIQLDIDPDRIGRNYPTDIGLVGDAQAILIELVYHIHRRIRERGGPMSEWHRASPLVRGDKRHDDPAARTSDGHLTPQRWRAELDEVLPYDAVVFSDIGGHMLHNIHELVVKRRQRFVINLGFGSMGHGTVAPIGAALGAPGRPVFALVGDGCFTMNGMELLVAAEYGIPVTWVVENNNMHGITWHCSKVLSGTPMKAARYRRNVEVAAIARAMGLAGIVVDRPGLMKDAVREALAHNGPAVIEVRVDPMVAPPLGARAKSLAGFIEK
jgi:acetolactate synthase-1/2/3 large subunit